MMKRVYINNKELIKLKLISTTLDGLLNGWVGDLMDKSYSCMGKITEDNEANDYSDREAEWIDWKNQQYWVFIYGHWSWW